MQELNWYCIALERVFCFEDSLSVQFIATFKTTKMYHVFVTLIINYAFWSVKKLCNFTSTDRFSTYSVVKMPVHILAEGSHPHESESCVAAESLYTAGDEWMWHTDKPTNSIIKQYSKVPQAFISIYVISITQGVSRWFEALLSSATSCFFWFIDDLIEWLLQISA